MARLGHRLPNTVSKVRRPTVLGPAVVFPAAKVTLAYQLTRRRLAPQVVTRSRLSPPPKILNPAVVSPAVLVRLADQLNRRQLAPQVVTRYKLRPPTVVQATLVPTGINATSSISGSVAPARAIVPAAISATSAVVGSFSTGGPPSPAQATIVTEFATRRHSARSRLNPPGAVSAFVPFVAPPVEQTIVHLTTVAVRTVGDYRRRTVLKTLRPPLYIQTVVSQPSADQLKLRIKIPIQPRRLPARIALISPAIINPIVLSTRQVTITTSLAAIQTRQRRRATVVRSKLSRPSATLQPIQPATINATSTMAATTIVRKQLIVPSPFTSTSTITGSIVRLRQVSGGVINATSDLLSVTLTGGTTQTGTDQPQTWAVHIHHHGR